MQRKSTARPHARHGFTLIEMLVAISILLVLMVITIAAVNVTAESDRVKAAAEQIKAHLNGARDRATFFGRNAGVRLIKDPSDPTMATGLVYLVQPEPYETGSIEVHRDPSTLQWTRLVGIGTNWHSLMARGQISQGKTTIMLNSRPFTFLTTALGPGVEELRLTKEYPGGSGAGPITLPEYSLLVEPVVASNQDVVNLGRGVGIDLDSSLVPIHWQIPGGYIDDMDILFSPRGDVQRGQTGGGGQRVFTDSIIQSGRITLVVAGIEDIALGNGVEVIDRKGPQHLVCVQASNARIYSSPVSVTDSNGNGRSDDPFEYAETGEQSHF